MTSADRNSDPASGTMELAGATAVAVVDALDLVAELPSTPQPVAVAAQDTAGELSQRIAAAGRSPAEVAVSTRSVVAAAGILALVSVMPSTPPTVASDAGAWSSALWDRLDGGAGGTATGTQAG